jgi:hypothetical protein
MSDPSSLLDANGHLTPAGLAALQAAPVGQAPAEVAHHLAGCAACQDRLLVASAPGPRPKPGRKPMAFAPSPGRTALLVLMTLIAIAMALWSLQRLVQP